MDFSEFFDACSALASSAGEFASLVVAALVSYLLVVARSIKRELVAKNLTRFRSASAPARRASRGSRGRPSSSALPTDGAARQVHSPSEESDYGLPKESPTPVERFIQSATQDDASPDLFAVGRRSPHDPHSASRAAGGGTGRGSDADGPADGGSAAEAGGILAPKRG